MDDSKLLNISGIDIVSTIEESISFAKKELNGLTDERTCIIYSSYIYEYLRKKHVLCNLVDTKSDLGMDYEHRFVVVFYNREYHYIVDLNYKQFGENDIFLDLYNKGYQLMDANFYHTYLDHIKEAVLKMRGSRLI